MPGREYLLKGLEDKDVKAYLQYQIDLAVLLGADRDRAIKEQTAAVEFEIALAKVWPLDMQFYFDSLRVKISFLFNRLICPEKSVAMPINCTIR